MPYNYNKLKQSDLALPRRLFILLVGLLLGCVTFSYFNPGAAADRPGAIQDSITARPTANRFDFANDALRALLRDESLTPANLAPSHGGISELRKPSRLRRTLPGSARQAAELQPLNHANARETRGSRATSQTPTSSAHSRAPNVAGWKKAPTSRSYEMPPGSRSRLTRLPPTRNWKSSEPTQPNTKSDSDRARPARSQRKRRSKRTGRSISRKKTKKQRQRTNWRHEVLFND